MTTPTIPEREPARVRPVVPLLPYQLEDFQSDARFRWNCWARQTGKSYTKSLRRIVRGLRRRRNQIFLSAGERQSRELMEKARSHCQLLRVATDFYGDRSFRNLRLKELEIRLPGGVRIIGLPANPSTARGFTGDVLLDEFAMHADDREIWSALFPTILRGDGELDVASTPRGRGNMFYHLQENAEFEHVTLTLPDAVAQGLDVDAEGIRRAMGDEALYRQEFLCEFLDESTAFLTHEQISACVDPFCFASQSADELGRSGRELFLGVDVGRLRDLTVIWVLGNERPARIEGRCPSAGANPLTTMAIIELANQPFRVQYERLRELLALRNVRRCCIDAGGLGMQLAEQAEEEYGGHRVESIRFTAALKSQLAGGLRIAVENRSIRIPPDERVRRDWHSVERTVTESGHIRLAAPRLEGSHADRFWAAALAVHAASDGQRIVDCVHGLPLRYARAGTW